MARVKNDKTILFELVTKDDAFAMSDTKIYLEVGRRVRYLNKLGMTDKEATNFVDSLMNLGKAADEKCIHMRFTFRKLYFNMSENQIDKFNKRFPGLDRPLSYSESIISINEYWNMLLVKSLEKEAVDYMVELYKNK